MIEHRSFGVVPVRKTKAGWEFFLVQHHEGHWAFPKGHQEAGESGEQTARRELAEETGLTVIDLQAGQPFVEEYTWNHRGQPSHKIVTYYLGLVEDRPISLQAKELRDGRWVSVDQAEDTLTFEAGKDVFRQAREHLVKNSLWT